MDRKPRVTPESTYVLEDEDIEQLDKLTLTSVIRDASDVAEDHEAEESQPEPDDLDFTVLSPED
jgi:hypothetical protein